MEVSLAIKSFGVRWKAKVFSGNFRRLILLKPLDGAEHSLEFFRSLFSLAVLFASPLAIKFA